MQTDLTFSRPMRLLFLLPLLVVFAAFWLLPMGALLRISTGEHGGAYLALLHSPRYLQSLISTVLLSLAVTAVTIVLSLVAGLFLSRRAFPGRQLLIAALTLPLAFPGVVVGFMVIMLAGRQGVFSDLTQAITGTRSVFAYSMTGLFLGYLYFSIPRVVLTVMAAAEKLDASLEEAARSLGARDWEVLRDVTLPALAPALLATGAMCFATSMGAFGTAFTLATDIDVLPMVIYTEFTLNANMLTAAALSLVLGAVTWTVLSLAHTAGAQSAAPSA
ncbi:ABC transporter permease [Andreprevotia chitinilytica]|uniref:ABC transporter permease n=1 Tax=Andreprevotia chitinilytica TaxID=396808 RepID=UPI000558FB2A|nr:ABC transporter permease [Andreprevotia chitinilytica]